jgi:hypothetical protein
MLPLDEDGEEPSQLSAVPRGRYWRFFGPVAWSFTSFLLIACLVLLVAAMTREPTEKECMKKVSVWCKSA